MPQDRPSITHAFRIDADGGPVEGYLTVGLYPEIPRRPGEVFLIVSNETQQLYPWLAHWADTWAIALSVALQHGWTAEEAVAKFRGRTGPIAGPTSDPQIPRTTSLVTYVARWLEIRFCGADEQRLVAQGAVSMESPPACPRSGEPAKAPQRASEPAGARQASPGPPQKLCSTCGAPMLGSACANCGAAPGT